MRLTAHFDGGCRQARGNVAAGAAVLFNEAGVELATRSQLLRGVTVPIAEYTGLHLALRMAAEHAGPAVGQTELLVLGDAELIVFQVTGHYRSNKPHLTSMRDLAWLLMAPFGSCEVRAFPKAGKHRKRRFGNVRADQLCGECMDAAILPKPKKIKTGGGPYEPQTAT